MKVNISSSSLIACKCIAKNICKSEKYIEQQRCYRDAAAKMLGVSTDSLDDFVNEKVPLSPDLALRISKVTGTSVESWMNMQ